jgi:hypothetical protein
MQWRRWGISLVSAALVVGGVVFVGQGLGLLQGRSFMVGDRTWAVIGAVLVVAGAALGWRELRRP